MRHLAKVGIIICVKISEPIWFEILDTVYPKLTHSGENPKLMWMVKKKLVTINENHKQFR